MLDPETLELLDKLKIMGEKFGVHIEPDRMAWDLGYANQILLEMGNTPDQEQGWVVLQLMQRLCLYDASEGVSEG
jgi:hypothetical protein